MRANLIRSLTVAALFCLSISAASAAEGISWVKSFAEAQRQARMTHKLIMLDFYTDW